jgi:hypothetical protein
LPSPILLSLSMILAIIGTGESSHRLPPTEVHRGKRKISNLLFSRLCI